MTIIYDTLRDVDLSELFKYLKEQKESYRLPVLTPAEDRRLDHKVREKIRKADEVGGYETTTPCCGAILFYREPLQDLALALCPWCGHFTTVR